MKKKVLTITSLAMAMAMTGGVSLIHAAEDAKNTQDTTVTYSNHVEVGSDPTWAVTIPTSIAIDEKSPSKEIKIEAVSKAAGKTIAELLADKTIKIAIASTNDFELKYENADPVKYELDKTAMSLTADKTSDTAKVTLKGIAKESGDHTDVLTFTLTTEEKTGE